MYHIYYQGDNSEQAYLVSDEREHRLLLRLTDADGVQHLASRLLDLTSCLLELTSFLVPVVVVSLAGLFTLGDR